MIGRTVTSDDAEISARATERERRRMLKDCGWL